MKPMTYVIVRKKNDPTAPRVTATPDSVDLDLFDVLDEHGNLMREEVLEEIRKMQVPPEPPEEPGKGKPPVALMQHPPHVPTHEASKKR